MEPLAEGVFPREWFEVGGNLARPTELQVQLREGLARANAELLESGDGPGPGGGLGAAGIDGAAPAGERSTQGRDRAAGIGGRQPFRVGDLGLEGLGIELAGLDAESIARRVRFEAGDERLAPGPERLSQGPRSEERRVGKECRL